VQGGDDHAAGWSAALKSVLAMMCAKFGAAYGDYMVRSGRLFPRVLR